MAEEQLFFQEGVSRMKRVLRKGLRILTAIVTAVGLGPLMTRTVQAENYIHSVTATSNLTTVLQAGNPLQRLTMNKIETGNDVVLESELDGYWEKKIDGVWTDIDSGTFTGGEWRYSFTVAVEGETEDRLADDITLTVDGQPWNSDGGIVYAPYDEVPYWYVWFVSPVFTVEDTDALSFNALSAWNDIVNSLNAPITVIDVSSGASGGKTPYTFSKVSGPDWLSVSADGKVSGTPTVLGPNVDLVIRVTDGNDNHADITLSVGDTVDGIHSFVSYMEGSVNEYAGPLSDLGVYGETTPDLTITGKPTDGNPYISPDTDDTYWEKTSGSNWIPYSGMITNGDYRLRTVVKIDAVDAASFWFSSAFALEINGEGWEIESIENADTGCKAVMVSPAFTVVDPRTAIKDIVAESETFENPEDYAHMNPKIGDPVFYPDFTVTEGQPVFVSSTSRQWERLTKTGGWKPYGETTFRPGYYRLAIQVRIEGEDSKTYTLDRFPTFMNNNVMWEQRESWAAWPAYSYAHFSSHQIAFPINHIWISGVTPPSAGALPVIDGITTDVADTAVNKTDTYWLVSDGAGNWTKTEAAFEDGKEYAIRIAVDPDQEYYAYFSSGATAYINGQAATVEVDERGFLVAELPMALLSASTDLYVVTAGSLNVRTGASVNSLRLGGLKYGDVIKAKAEAGGWVLIDYDGKEGWVNRKYLALTYSEETAIPPENVTITAGALNVREAPDQSSYRIGGVKADDVVLVTGVVTDGDGNQWLVLDYDGQLGFIMAKYTSGVSAKVEDSEELLTISALPADFDFSSMIEYTTISDGNVVSIGEADYRKNEDGTVLIGFFPDDAVNFSLLTKENVKLPDGCELDVLEVIHNSDGSIAIRLGKETPEEIVYTFSKGADGSWTKGSGADLEFIVNRSVNDAETFSHFISIEIDGSALAAADYTAASGSLNARVKAAALEKLAEGTHTLKVNFDDGNAETKLTIAPAVSEPEDPAVEPGPVNKPDEPAKPAQGTTPAPVVRVAVPNTADTGE